jgi:hypothetical protein
MTNLPITYSNSFLAKEESDNYYQKLLGIEWVEIGDTPRKEYYCNDFLIPYTYGQGRGVRTYNPQPLLVRF